MTKINKLGKSTFVIAILSFLLVAVLAFGGTYAYFSATSGDAISDSVTLGHLEVALAGVSDGDILLVEEKAVPNQPILDKAITLDMGDTNIDAYVRLQFDIEVKLTGGADVVWGTGEGKAGIEEEDFLSGDELAGWVKVGNYYYQGANEEADATVVSADVELDLDIRISKAVGNYFQDAVVTITISAEAVQADFLGDAGTADSTISIEDLSANWDAIVAGTY